MIRLSRGQCRWIEFHSRRVIVVRAVYVVIGLLRSNIAKERKRGNKKRELNRTDSSLCRHSCLCRNCVYTYILDYDGDVVSCSSTRGRSGSKGIKAKRK